MSFASENRSREWRSDHAQEEPRSVAEAAPDQDDAVDTAGAGGRNSVLERAFLVLEQVACGARPLNLTEMSRAARLPLPTTYRLAKILVKVGALEKDAGRYTLGPVWSEWSEATRQE